MRRIFSFLKLFRKDLIVMVLAIFHRDTPRRIKGLMLLAILYLLSPIDLIPDTIPVVGWLDDAVLVPAVICGLESLLPSHVRAYAEAKADKAAHVAPVFVVLASLFVLAWAILIIYGVVHFLQWLF